MLEVRGVQVAFDGVRALDGLDLDVGDGEVVALLGPSGCGKTTLLRVIAGLEPPAAGRIVLDGRDLATVATHERGVGLMFQDYALFPHRDVAGNVAFGLRMRGDPPPRRAERVEEVLALVGLTGFGQRSVATLSGGERQRVALARALAPAPSLLMLDEPLGALDRTLRDRLVLELSELFARLSISVVYVTHDQAEALALADRVVVMQGGRIAQQGSPEQVWREPADAFVARFLGLTNVFATVISEGSAVLPWGSVPADGESVDGMATLLIRPEAVLVGAPTADSVPATVEGVAFRGDHTQVWVAMPGGARLEARVRDPATAPAFRPEIGSKVHVVIDGRGVLLLGPGPSAPPT